jgi:hypothetical protein
MVQIRAIVAWAKRSPNPTEEDVNRAWTLAREAEKKAFRLEMEVIYQRERKLEVERLKREVKKRLLFLTQKIRCGRQLKSLMPGAPVDEETSPSPR